MFTKDKMLAMCVVFIHLTHILSNNRKNFHKALLSHYSSVMDPDNSEITEFHCIYAETCIYHSAQLRLLNVLKTHALVIYLHMNLFNPLYCTAL